jgi:hypothetical protein
MHGERIKIIHLFVKLKFILRLTAAAQFLRLPPRLYTVCLSVRSSFGCLNLHLPSAVLLNTFFMSFRFEVFRSVHSARCIPLGTFRSVHSRIIKHLFHYTQQIHDIYSFHVFTVLLLRVSALPTPPSGRILCPLLETTCCSAATVYGYCNSYFVNVHGRACIYLSYNKLTHSKAVISHCINY